MGINPTQSNFKTFTFGGINSGSYGVYITGGGVFNAPERNVEMIEIPARNGAFALDKGNFNNIEVTYPASIATDNETDFAEAVSDLRNFLCSKIGYVRLEDEYNPNEYRMAIYKSGLEVSHDMLIAGEFDITFECKPQRYLTSGETAQAVTSGGTLTNPTLFDSHPKLEIEGYGDINFNGSTITLVDDLVGNVIVEQNGFHSLPYSTNVSDIYVNANDIIDLDVTSYDEPAIGFVISRGDGQTFTITNYTDSNFQYGGLPSAPLYSIWNNGEKMIIDFPFTNLTFNALTAKTAWISITLAITNSDGYTFTINPKAIIQYDGEGIITYSLTGVIIPPQYKWDGAPKVNMLTVEVQSTATTYGHPTIIDCDTGATYAIKNGVMLSLGRYVLLGSKLPTLATGINTITYDNTITSLKVSPRWWKV